MVLYGVGWWWMVADGGGWWWMLLDGVGWRWMVSDGGGWWWMVVDSVRWLHVSKLPVVCGVNSHPTQATPPVKKNRSGSTQHNPKGTGREKGSREGSKRLPTQKVVPRKTPVVHDGISHYDGTGRGVADGSHHGGGRTVLVEDKKILTIDGRDYDTAPENYHPTNGSGMVGMALGVGVVMSLTGVLVGVVIMKLGCVK
ncbi:hypothetical protein BSL78_14604 [Apostichopus japonicus]|uniref:Uncharacterized protein n=1 Tax=Stichopus japonicus TaxID=307972 RepID=A0A2G8KKG8_STIJA|nr:hypothetical protein BSL78_14604 [Apostichopus japonicus]